MCTLVLVRVHYGYDSLPPPCHPPARSALAIRPTQMTCGLQRPLQARYKDILEDRSYLNKASQISFHLLNQVPLIFFLRRHHLTC